MSTGAMTEGQPVDGQVAACTPSPQPPQQPDPAPDSLLARVMRAHPALTREEAIADIIEFGGNPFEDPSVIHAWRRRGLPAYARVSPEPEGRLDERGRRPAADPTTLLASASPPTSSGRSNGRDPQSQNPSTPGVATGHPGTREDTR
jgi:hypothetical protein